MYSLLLGRKFLYKYGCFTDHWKQQVYVRSGKDAYLVPRTAPPLEEIEPLIYNPSAAAKGKLRKGQQPTLDKIDPMKAKPATVPLLPKVHNNGLEILQDQRHPPVLEEQVDEQYSLDLEEEEDEREANQCARLGAGVDDLPKDEKGSLKDAGRQKAWLLTTTLHLQACLVPSQNPIPARLETLRPR